MKLLRKLAAKSHLSALSLDRHIQQLRIVRALVDLEEEVVAQENISLQMCTT
jgi:hypothetical protein